MALDPIASRYAQAVFDTAKAEGTVDTVLEELGFLGGIFRDQPEFRQFLWNPDVDPDQKVALLDRLYRGSWSSMVKGLVQMAIGFGRAEHLPDIIQAFRAAVDKDRGQLRVTVRCVHPLSEDVLKRLRTDLERREHKTVELRMETAPALIGGIQILLDHRVIDGSVRGQLSKLRQQLKAIRVT
jgi:F-type H+-transporting ATPase subunit delta